MTKNRPKFNLLNSVLKYLGLPFFRLSILLIATIGFSLLLTSRLFSKIYSHGKSLLLLSKHLPPPKLPKLPKPHKLPKPLRLPRLSTPDLSLITKIKLPTIHLPEFNLRLSLILSIFIIVSIVFYFEILRDLPDPRTLVNFPSKLTTQILDRNGKLLYKVFEDENRTLIKLEELPDYVKNAFLTAEDKDFYRHNGFSPIGLIRATYKNFTQDRLEGGSTITQQLIKNTLLSNEKTFTRKIKELILAFKVESLFSKDKIFEMYLNQVGFGGTAYGIQEASRQYFNLDAKYLSVAQAAFLAGLPQAPSKYSPFGDNPDLANSRQKQVLHQMAKNGFLSVEDLDKALATKLEFGSAKTEIYAPHFVMFVKDILTSQLGDNVVNHGGLIVTTTLDLELQNLAQKIVTEEVGKLKNFNVTNGAALITDPQTGEILAMVGSKDYFNLNEGGQVNLTTSLRQPGSSIKPLNYALAFEKGLRPSSIIEDKPISFNIVGQGPWVPKNYDGRFHGIISLRQALGSSYNIPSIILLSKNGIQNFANLAQSMGITSWDEPERYGLSMALGSLEVKMVDLATAYSTFANKGVTTPLKSIISVNTREEKKVFLASCPMQKITTPENATALANEQSCSQKQSISPLTAYLITDVLADNSARTPAFGYNSILNIKPAKVAVKTGTSNDLRDNWTIGYTQNYLVATWVGNNNNEPMSKVASGITGASPIWAKIFNRILEKYPQSQEIQKPENLVSVPICTLTGTLTCEGCPTRIEYFTKGTEPKVRCDPQYIKSLLEPKTQPSTSPTPQIL